MGVKYSDERESMLYISFFDGKMKYNVPEGSPGAVARVNASNRTVHERFIDEISGHITSIKRKDSDDYGASWAIVLTDFSDGSKMQIEIRRSGMYADRFFRRLPNVDFSKPVILTAFKSHDKNQFLVKQDDKTVDYYWTKENPGKLPPMEKLIVKGEEVWDDTKKMDYLEFKVLPALLEEMQKALATVIPSTDLGQDDIPKTAEPEMPEFTADDMPPAPEEDDLPF